MALCVRSFFLCSLVPWLVAADCNQNGIDDAAELAAGDSVDCNADGVPDECQSTPLHFGFREGADLDLGQNEPRAGLARDLDGDGRLDVVIAGSANTLQVYLGGEGMAFSARPPLETGLVAGLDAADLDGDADLDLVFAASNEIAVAFHQGGGALSEPVRYPASSGLSAIRSADVNGDDAPDVVALSRLRHDVLVYLNAGDGTFHEPATYEGGKLPSALDLVDFSGDGALEIVVANARTNDFSVFPNLGDGTFGESTQIAAPARPVGAFGVDFDGDGDYDLVTGTEEGVSVRLNSGDGVFDEPWLQIPLSVGSLQCADLDRDGDTDIAWGNADGSRVHVIENLGGGRSRAPRTIIADVQHLLSGDVDGDGLVDLIPVTRARNLVTFLFGGDPGADAVTFVTSIAPIDQEPHHAHLADVDGDGDLDAISGNGDNVSYSILFNDGVGNLAAPQTHPLQAVLVPPPDRENASRVDVIRTGDIDGDGQIDLVMSDGWRSLLRVFEGNGDGTFGAFREFPTGRGTFSYRLGDLDGDGDLDAAVTLSRENGIAVLFNDGSGGLDERVVLPAGDGPFSSIDADFDGDGIRDLAVSNSQGADVSVFISNGDGTFQERVEYLVGGAPRSVLSADFDEDGDQDLVSSNRVTRDLSIILNRGDGTFGDPTDYWMRLIPFDAVPVDINLDGHLDVAVANEENHTISILLGRGDGTFRPPFQKDNNTGRGLRFVLAGDMNLDGVVDLVGANRQSQDMTLHINQLASEPMGLEDYTGGICTGRDFVDWSLETPMGSGGDRAMKYTLPARENDGELLDTLFHNLRRYPLHQEFLQAVFPDRFPALTPEEYNRLTGRRETRDYFVGVIHRLRLPEGLAYGFSVLVDTSSPDEVLSEDEVGAVFQRLSESFTLRPLGFFPQSTAAREAARDWASPGFPVYLDDSSAATPYEPYTRAVGYGRVRILDPEAFAEANEGGEISFQTVLVLHEAPRDIEGVVGGVVTAQPQGPLSHVAIRTARRRTPNAFVADAIDVFEPLDGKLVRLEVRAADYTVEEATQEEAEAFWAENRPELSQQPQLDGDFADLSSLAEIAAMDAASPQEVRFGGKATNLARLGRILEGTLFEEFREVGFGIPVHYYLEFLRTNTIPSVLDDTREVTYEEYLAELFQQESFQTDSVTRFQALDDFRDFARDNAVVSQELVEKIHARVAEVFPSTRTPVRFRSSSNVEDALEFNGAGLYESTGGCVDDDLDDDEEGPSLCDSSKENERTIGRALRKVWTSLYTFRAFEERAFYGIPEDQVGMAILVSRAFPDELANGVCFTGNLSNPLDRRYVVTAQVGEESVVSPAPGVLPERDLLDVRDGEVVEIVRPLQGSTLVEPGTWVLSDEQLREMGRFLAFVDANFPLDLGDHGREEVLLDLEFKLEPDETLAFKQVRPFLLTEPPPPAPEFVLEVPDRVICGMFSLAGAERGPLEEYELKSQIRLRPGAVALPTARDTFNAELFDEVRFGPTQELAEPMSPGRFRVVSVPGRDGVTIYRFTYEKRYVLGDGREFEVGVRAPLLFEARGNEALDPPLVLDEAFFTTQPGSEAIQATLDGLPLVRYGSCEHADLPRFSVRIELEDGTKAELDERFEEQESLFETGPASLQRAVVEVADERRAVSDYWRLVYSAFRHNTRVRYWVVFEEPIQVPGLDELVFAIQLEVPEEEVEAPKGTYLGAAFEALGAVGLSSFEKGPAGTEPLFVRGDGSGDGALNLVDAVALLEYLFRGAVPPTCRKAADWNDSGTINVADAVGLLAFVFRGGPAAPAPTEVCGVDPTVDDLGCERYPPCE